jgi:alpha-tubulin suppressor-like RCC1 family protein
MHPVPAAIPNLDAVTSVAVGELFACAVRRDRAVECWGWGGRGQLGHIPPDAGSEPPATVTGLAASTQVAAGDAFACALGASGAVACWGADDHGQLGDGGGADATGPRRVPGVDDAVAIAAGAEHACAVRAGGTITCWGDDELGQVGDGTIGGGTVRTPVAVVGIDDAVAVAAGATHTCARRANGALACWGGNAFGQLGDGTTATRLTPVPVER